MTQPSGVVRAAWGQQQVTFQVDGQGTMLQSPALRQFAEACLSAGVGACRVDLRHCTYLDSTFIGTLLCLKRKWAGLPGGQLTLIRPSGACCDLLKQMRLDRFFATTPYEEAVCDEAATPSCSPSWHELTGTVGDLELLKRTVVAAHEELACLPGAAGEPFRELAGRMCREAADTKQISTKQTAAPRTG